MSEAQSPHELIGKEEKAVSLETLRKLQELSRDITQGKWVNRQLNQGGNESYVVELVVLPSEDDIVQTKDIARFNNTPERTVKGTLKTVYFRGINEAEANAQFSALVPEAIPRLVNEIYKSRDKASVSNRAIPLDPNSSQEYPSVSDEELAQWQTLTEATTPGLWRAEGLGSEGYVIHPDDEFRLRIGEFTRRTFEQDRANSLFIAAAHNAFPHLIDEVRKSLSTKVTEA